MAELDGVIVSDWLAARDTVRTALGGLDIAMPANRSPWGDRLVAAVRDGLVPAEVVDEHARRVLRLAARVGALASAPESVPPGNRPAVIDGAALARQIASRSAVRAANPQGLLPLDPTAISTVAVIGALAMDARVLGGGSATVFPAHAVSPLEGLTTALPDSVKLTFAVGADVHTDMLAEAKPPQWSGLRATFRDSAGQAVHATALATGAGRWLQLPDGVDASMLSSVEISGRLRAEVGGTHQLRIRGIGDFVLTAAGQLVFDGRLRPATEDIATSLFSPPEHRIAVDLAAGSVTDVPLLHQVVFAPGFTAVPPNTQLKYCNLGYQLLGEIVGRAASAHHQPPRRVPGAVHHRRLLRHRRAIAVRPVHSVR